MLSPCLIIREVNRCKEALVKDGIAYVMPTKIQGIGWRETFGSGDERALPARRERDMDLHA